MIVYLRLLDAREDRADWREVVRAVLHRDPAEDEILALRCCPLARAEWMTTTGYKDLLAGKITQA